MAKLTDTESAQSPASKKLGSKLKNAKNSTDESITDARPEGIDTNDEEIKSDKKDKKKRKKSSSEDAGPETDADLKKKKKRRHSEDDDEKKDKDSESKKSKKKRVSFGPGTKENDGDDDSDSDDVDMDEAATTDGAEADTEDKENDKALEDMKKRKREKKKQRKTGTAPTEAQVHETPILSYLSHYHKARATWKFQKNRETNLFKHLYSLEHVPSQYNTSLLAYMQGLRGDAAKQRLSDAARDVIKADMDLDKPKDDESAENQEENTNTDYIEAINAFRDHLPEADEKLDSINIGEDLNAGSQKRLPKRQRAELVFFAVAGKLFSAEDAKPKRKPRSTEPPANKKRKNRTVVVDISSSDESTSSSGSSSDSDSDDSDASASAPTPAKQAAVDTPSKKESKKKKNLPVREEKPKPAPVPKVPKKTQKRKLRTAQIEISSSESDSD